MNTSYKLIDRDSINELGSRYYAQELEKYSDEDFNRIKDSHEFEKLLPNPAWEIMVYPWSLGARSEFELDAKIKGEDAWNLLVQSIGPIACEENFHTNHTAVKRWAKKVEKPSLASLIGLRVRTLPSINTVEWLWFKRGEVIATDWVTAWSSRTKMHHIYPSVRIRFSDRMDKCLTTSKEWSLPAVIVEES